MIGRVLIVLAVIVFISISFNLYAVYAAPVGNIAKPAMLKSAMISPDKEKVQLGIVGEGEFDLTFDRGTKGDEDNTELYFLTQKLGIVFADKLILYGLLGAAWFEEDFRSNAQDVEIETERDMAWGVGATLILYEREIEMLNNSILRFGVDGRYRSTKADLKKAIVGGTDYKLPHTTVDSKDFKYEDWQVAAETSLQWKSFIPYFGVKYSDLEASSELTISGTTYKADDIEAKENIGVFVGMDILVLDYISYTIEGRFIDERALTLSGTIRF